jgi:hypothetical protein
VLRVLWGEEAGNNSHRRCFLNPRVLRVCWGRKRETILIAVVSSIRECFGRKRAKKKVVACMSKVSSENSLVEICCVERERLRDTQTKERSRRRRRTNQAAKACR